MQDTLTQSNVNQLENILLSSSHFFTNTCLGDSSTSIAIVNTFCSDQVDGAVVFFGTLTTNSVSLTQEMFTALRNWVQTGPALLLNGIPFGVDLNCGLLLQSDPQFECQPNGTLATPDVEPVVIPTTIIIIVFSTAVGLGLLVVVILFCVICIRKLYKKKGSGFRPTQFVRYGVSRCNINGQIMLPEVLSNI